MDRVRDFRGQPTPPTGGAPDERRERDDTTREGE